MQQLQVPIWWDKPVDIKHLGKYLRKSYNKYKKQIEEKYKGKLSGSTIEELVDARVRHELESEFKQFNIR